MTQSPSDRYLTEWTRLACYFADDRLDDALALAQRMKSGFPERAAAVGHTEACLLTALGRADEAIDVMKALAEDGRWWSARQLADPDLGGLVIRAGYPDLATTMRECAVAAVADANDGSPSIMIVGPEDQVSSSIVVVLHMRGASGAETAEIWAPVVEAGIVVVTVESSLLNGDGQSCWDDPDLALRDVGNGVDLARTFGSPVVLAGASQGAGVAARLALAGTVGKLAGFLCVVGAPAPGTWNLEQALPGALVSGGNDRLTSGGQRAFRRELLALGLDVELVEVPDLDHAYPSDWGDLAPRLLERITARGET